MAVATTNWSWRALSRFRDVAPPIPLPSLTALQADFHGARLYVEQAASPQLVGVAGIVAMETENTFKLVRESDALCTVPKRGCVFRVSVGAAPMSFC